MKDQVQGIFNSLKFKAEKSSVQQEATRRYYEQLIHEANNLPNGTQIFRSSADIDSYDMKKRFSTHSAISLSQGNTHMRPSLKKRPKKSNSRSPSVKQSSKVSLRKPSYTSRNSLPKKTLSIKPPSLRRVPQSAKNLHQSKSKKLYK